MVFKGILFSIATTFAIQVNQASATNHVSVIGNQKISGENDMTAYEVVGNLNSSDAKVASFIVNGNSQIHQTEVTSFSKFIGNLQASASSFTGGADVIGNVQLTDIKAPKFVLVSGKANIDTSIVKQIEATTGKMLITGSTIDSIKVHGDKNQYGSSQSAEITILNSQVREVEFTGRPGLVRTDNLGFGKVKVINGQLAKAN